MNSLVATLRRFTRFGIAVPGVLLLFGLVVGGVHDHESTSDHSCAICTMSHAPATVTVAAAPLQAPTTCHERVVQLIAEIRAALFASDHLGRAPPLS